MTVAALAPVVQDDLEVALTDEQPVGGSRMATPGAEGAREEPRLIDMDDGQSGWIPLGPKDFGDDTMVARYVTDLAD
jgi:hypothetical protein